MSKRKPVIVRTPHVSRREAKQMVAWVRAFTELQPWQHKLLDRLVTHGTAVVIRKGRR